MLQPATYHTCRSHPTARECLCFCD